MVTCNLCSKEGTGCGSGNPKTSSYSLDWWLWWVNKAIETGGMWHYLWFCVVQEQNTIFLEPAPEYSLCHVPTTTLSVWIHDALVTGMNDLRQSYCVGEHQSCTQFRASTLRVRISHFLNWATVSPILFPLFAPFLLRIEMSKVQLKS